MFFFFSSRRRHTRSLCDWSSDVCSSDLVLADKRNQESSRKAIEYLEQAVRLDPNYALAYARLANAHSTLARSEERRVGKECSSRLSPDYKKRKTEIVKVYGRHRKLER